MTRQKRVAAVHDISGFGKCSLTVALPILSAAGIETSIMPTAVLSTHTGGFTGYTYHDLTDDLRPFTHHWKSLGLTFDALYSGFLGSFEQLEIVSEFFDTFKTSDNLIVVDPAMADNGELYSLFTPDFAAGMAKLCAKASLIVPNITEAALMLGETYHDGPYSKEYIEKLLHGLSKLGPGKVVLTGVFFDDRELGAASLDAGSGEINYSFSGRIEGFYHGTGDIFASALLAGLLNGQRLDSAAQLAVDFTQGSIIRTREAGTDVRFGVNFEAGLPRFIRQLGLL
jgi:pyridoxine kinase